MQTVFVLSQVTFDKIAAANKEWSEMFEHVETSRVVDMHTFHGGVDWVECKSKRIVFYDRGCNNRSRDLVLLRDKVRVGPEDHPIIAKMQ